MQTIFLKHPKFNPNSSQIKSNDTNTVQNFKLQNKKKRTNDKNSKINFTRKINYSPYINYRISLLKLTFVTRCTPKSRLISENWYVQISTQRERFTNRHDLLPIKPRRATFSKLKSIQPELCLRDISRDISFLDPIRPVSMDRSGFVPRNNKMAGIRKRNNKIRALQWLRNPVHTGGCWRWPFYPSCKISLASPLSAPSSHDRKNLTGAYILRFTSWNCASPPRAHIKLVRRPDARLYHRNSRSANELRGPPRNPVPFHACFTRKRPTTIRVQR